MLNELIYKWNSNKHNVYIVQYKTSFSSLKWWMNNAYPTKSLNALLIFASQSGNLYLVKLLIKRGANIDYKKGKPFKYAVKRGQLFTAKFLYKHTKYKYSIIPLSVKYRQHYILEWMRHRTHEIIHYACIYGNLEAIKLCFHSIDINDPILLKYFKRSVYCGHLNIVKYFLDNGLNIDSHINNCIYWAKISNNYEISNYIEDYYGYCCCIQ